MQLLSPFHLACFALADMVLLVGSYSAELWRLSCKACTYHVLMVELPGSHALRSLCSIAYAYSSHCPMCGQSVTALLCYSCSLADLCLQQSRLASVTTSASGTHTTLPKVITQLLTRSRAQPVSTQRAAHTGSYKNNPLHTMCHTVSKALVMKQPDRAKDIYSL
jgi:hypothetical protein